MGWVSMIKPTNQAHKIKNACLKKLSANNFLYYFICIQMIFTSFFGYVLFVSNIAIDKITVHG